MIAIDFGTGSALAIWGKEGQIEKKDLELPRVKGGKTPRDEFILVLRACLARDNVVVESPTIGSSGAEPADVQEVIDESTRTLFTLPARAVKNHRMDFNLPNPKSYAKYKTGSDKSQEEAHVLDAEILYRIATTEPNRLRVWHVATPCDRVNRSVRPHDKRLYRGDEPDRLMGLLPEFETLPEDLQRTFGVGGTYSRRLAMPYAMALEEPFLHEGDPEKIRKRFEKIIGLYDHGYPSFYRRANNSVMQKIAADNLGIPRYKRSEVSREERKKAWKMATKQIRTLFHLSIR